MWNLAIILDSTSRIPYSTDALITATLAHGGECSGEVEHDYSFPFFRMFDPMSELTGGAQQDDDAGDASVPAPASRGGDGNRKFADELHSVTIHGRQRTFYIDLKQSTNGKFFKVSEKSRGGQKTTIMFDAEDLDQFLQAFEEMKAHLK